MVKFCKFVEYISKNLSDLQYLRAVILGGVREARQTTFNYHNFDAPSVTCATSDLTHRQERQDNRIMQILPDPEVKNSAPQELTVSAAAVDGEAI